MDTEQTPPKKMDFKTVLAAFCVTILVAIAIAWAVVGFDGKRLIPKAFTRTNTTRLVQPAQPPRQGLAARRGLAAQV